MRLICRLLVPFLGLFGTGCDMLVNFTRNVVFEVARCSDEAIECIEFHRQAGQAWKEFNQHCDKPLSADFARGFKQGYAEYLVAGGCGEPPPAPPCGYWMTKGQLHDYFQAVQDWGNGYRTGAALARAAGVRPAGGVVPLPAPGPGGVWPPPANLNGWPGWPGLLQQQPPEPMPLPLPRKDGPT